MKIRLISGSCYVAILIAFYCLKAFVHDFCFDVLVYAFALIGTYEMLRALGERVTKAERGVVYAFAIVCIPACALLQYYRSWGVEATWGCTFLLAIALLALLVADHENTTLESIGSALLAAVYPTLLLTLLVLGNHLFCPPALENVAFDSRLLILFVFVVSPCADSIAYVFGCSFKKYLPAKMAPTISPNKTVIGGVGGLVGGVLGAVALYFIYGATVGSYENMGIWLTVYINIGLLGAVATEFGDLIESCIKRKVGIKDMGKIMPGHGGVLDRIDGTLFATIVTYAAFTLVYMMI